MKLDFQTWLERVRVMLISIGYKQTTTLDPAAWKLLYADGYNPYEAINAMEFDGNLKWADFRYLQSRNGYEDPLKLWEEIGVIPKSYQTKSEHGNIDS